MCYSCYSLNQTRPSTHMLPLPRSEKIDCPNHGGDACTLQILLPKTHGRTTPRPTKLEQIPRVLKSPGTGRTSAYRLFSKRFMHWQGVTGEAPVTQTLPREESVLNGGRGARPRPQRTLHGRGPEPASEAHGVPPSPGMRGVSHARRRETCK